LFERLFEQIVRQCVEVGLVQGKHLSVDGSFVEANAAKESRIPREQLAEAAQVHHTVRQYLREVEEQNPVEEPAHEQDRVSTTDPDSTHFLPRDIKNMKKIKFVVKVNQPGNRPTQSIQRVDPTPIHMTTNRKLALVMGKFVAEDAIKSLQSSQCMPELESVELGV
jgi:hypothetical protein